MSSRDKPWDCHNSIYAESLEVMAAFVESLPDDDPVLRQLDDYPAPDSYGGGSELHTYTIHLGDRWKVFKPEEYPEVFRQWAEFYIENYDEAENKRERNLSARIRRALKKQEQTLRKCRETSKWFSELGRWYILDIRTNTVIAKDVRLVPLAHELEVLVDWQME